LRWFGVGFLFVGRPKHVVVNRYVFHNLIANKLNVVVSVTTFLPYRNSVGIDQQQEGRGSLQIELHDQTRQAFLQFSEHRADCQLLKRGKIRIAAQGSNSVTSQMGKKNVKGKHCRNTI